ncbi:putative methylmalonate-semialdehyde dehydrogenase [acylating], mitochondrial [Parelaphostrongylus tenuis]|uniref:Probable methylmalonate-semialdehyde/malonate-semialdehyde dehydrogenase [acylating], mitochondrial n=1 Tax=Parelaphostrongylus tenuis TaxID=148309 RepID=A0AAD5LXP1_PARTN|nr:putative methylmalonate-semialdehyde dehydrogenase [acylating], mitochondrial [Parelaphostrongylus tenuis]
MLSGLKRLSVRCGQQYVSLSTTTSAYGESTVKMWIDGRPVESKTSEWIDLTNPATNEVISRVPKCTQAEMQTAVDSCKKAFDSWKSVSPLTRQQALFRLQSLIKRDMKKIADNITKEQGKTLPDAEGDVSRGLQVVEHACSVPSLMLGETLPNVSRDMDTYSWRIPLGVISWYLPVQLPGYDSPMDVSIALATGNTMVLKPSEQDPGVCMMLVELAKEAGVPDGCVNVIHGQHEAVTILTFTQSHSLELIKLVNISTNAEHVMGNGCNRIWEQGIMEWSCLTVTKSRHSISRHGESELHHCRHYGDGICLQNG